MNCLNTKERKERNLQEIYTLQKVDTIYNIKEMKRNLLLLHFRFEKKKQVVKSFQAFPHL